MSSRLFSVPGDIVTLLNCPRKASFSLGQILSKRSPVFKEYRLAGFQTRSNAKTSLLLRNVSRYPPIEKACLLTRNQASGNLWQAGQRL